MKKSLSKVSWGVEYISTTFSLDIPYFLRGGFFGIMQQIVGVSCGLFISYLFGHYVSRNDFGQYTLVLSIIGFLNFLTLPGIDTALIQSVQKGFDRSFLYGAWLKFVFSLIGSVALLGWGLWYTAYSNPTIGFLLFIASIAFPFISAPTNYPSFLVAKRLFAQHATLASLSSIFYVTVLSGSIFFWNNPLGLLCGYFLALIIPYSISFIYCTRFVRPTSTTDPQLASYGLFLTGAGALSWIAANAGNIIVGMFLGPDSLAVYAVAGKLLTSIEKNLIVLYKPITSKLAIQTTADHWLTLKRHGFSFILFGILLSFLAWIFTPFFIKFFFTAKYIDAIYLGQFMALTLIPLPIHWVMNDMLIFQKKKIPQLLNSTITDVIKVILFILCIPKFGLYGLIGVAILDRFLHPLFVLGFLLLNRRAQ